MHTCILIARVHFCICFFEGSILCSSAFAKRSLTQYTWHAIAYYYDYDAAGNILKVEKGTVNSAGTLTKTTEQTYTYNDTDWHDLLTKLNGTPIVYEGQTYDPETNEVGGSILSGNPKYYNGWNFDWQRGRELASAEQNDGTTNTTLTYAYDADGIRTSKTYTVETYETRYTVTFVADGTTVKTMTVADGYTLKTGDYPTVPAKSGYTGSWNKYTDAIHANITIEAVYEEIVYYTVRFVAQRVTVKTMTVEAGYILQDTDYPDIPQREGYTAIWGFHAKVINKNTTITAQYTKTSGGGGDIPIPSVRPTDPWEIMSEDLPEPIEPQDVGEPDDTTNTSDATGNTAETQASHPGQVLVSTQTVTHEYMTLSGKIMRETITQGDDLTEILDFLYDESGRPFALNYSTNGGSSFITYYYVLNLQGDVVKLVTSSGSAVATYEYDAWGNILSKSGSMADKNPLRYRGYYYDSETGFYYLQSRYYDPTMRRFLNADSFASTGQGFIGTNMFAYCGNNPVSRSDITGGSWLDELIETAKEAIRFVLHAGNTLARKAGIDTAALGAPFLQMEADKNGVYHAAFNCWQQVFGYADLYDSVFDIGTSMNTDQFEFSANGENYVLWVWKADYINLGAGAELGIYYAGPDWWQADPDLAMDMSLSLYYQGKNIGSYHGLHWWPTAFNPAYQNVQASDLTAVYTVKFDSPTMYNGFAARHSGRWICDPHTYTAVLTYH